ncbi:MAG: hypothetical protein J0M17_27095, partial [Planctomycetes bacterium]|nr:hypothetical protein [Planctomycetota bacterium]
MLFAAWAVAYFVMYREGAIRLQQPVEPAAQWTLEQFLPVIIAAGLIAALVFGFFTTASNTSKQLAADPRLKNRRFILKANGYTASSDQEST